MSSQPLLAVENLSVEVTSGQGFRAAVRDVSLSIAPGEAVGLVGESGSGKSMTALAVIRLLPSGARATGTIRYCGTDVFAMSSRRAREYRAGQVAMIFQDPRAHINPVRRIGDFLTEGLRNAGMPRPDAYRIAVDLLEQVRIPGAEDVLRRYPHQLSGGMLQRVMIASAIALEPNLVLADEPTTALDVTTQAEVVAILDELRRERQMGLLFITHDLELAEAICDRIVVIYAGSSVEEQESERLYSRPLHPYTAGLLRSRPSLTEAQPRLTALPGTALAAYQAPAGCAFADRCPHVERICRVEEQYMRPVAGGLAACRRAEELRAALATHTLGVSDD